MTANENHLRNIENLLKQFQLLTYRDSSRYNQMFWIE